MMHYMAAITAYLNDEGRWIDRYAWFTDIYSQFPITHLYLRVIPGTPTPSAIGRYYALVTPSAHEPGFRFLMVEPAVFSDIQDGFLPTPTPDDYPPPYP
jgi:hypothetical protein